MAQRSPVEAVKAALAAYVAKDRPAIEALIAHDYRFTSPMDNALDRQGYFEICWPASATMTAATVLQSAENGEMAFVVYEAEGAGGRRFQNCEMHRVAGGMILATEVYFGWNLPHPAREGEHQAEPSARQD